MVVYRRTGSDKKHRRMIRIHATVQMGVEPKQKMPFVHAEGASTNDIV